MRMPWSKETQLDTYDIQVLSIINKAGGFADFGAVGSMPLGYLMDGSILSTKAYYSAKKLIAAKKIKQTGKISSKKFPDYLTTIERAGEIYK